MRSGITGQREDFVETLQQTPGEQRLIADQLPGRSAW